LQVIDISNPASPLKVGSCDTSGHAYGIAVGGNYAYVADGEAGLQVIDVSDPANPQQVGGYDTSGVAYDVAVSGNYACMANSRWGLAILNLAPAPRPRISAITRGNGTATVYYTNTLPGTNYTLEYCTDLSSGIWQPVGTQPAGGTSASQTDPAAGGAQRYYRVAYQP
jgi:hypothetical protein